MKFWLVKTEPETYSWNDLVEKGEDMWEGVRNYQARNFLKEMAIGDIVFVYHSGKAKEVVGIAKVSKEAYLDPTDDTDKWWAVSLVPEKGLNKAVSLQVIKENSELREMKLVKNSRLSVLPVSELHASIVMELAETK